MKVLLLNTFVYTFGLSDALKCLEMTFTRNDLSDIKHECPDQKSSAEKPGRMGEVWREVFKHSIEENMCTENGRHHQTGWLDNLWGDHLSHKDSIRHNCYDQIRCDNNEVQFCAIAVYEDEQEDDWKIQALEADREMLSSQKKELSCDFSHDAQTNDQKTYCICQHEECNKKILDFMLLDERSFLNDNARPVDEVLKIACDKYFKETPDSCPIELSNTQIIFMAVFSTLTLIFFFCEGGYLISKKFYAREKRRKEYYADVTNSPGTYDSSKHEPSFCCGNFVCELWRKSWERLMLSDTNPQEKEWMIKHLLQQQQQQQSQQFHQQNQIQN